MNKADKALLRGYLREAAKASHGAAQVLIGAGDTAKAARLSVAIQTIETLLEHTKK